LSRLAWLNLGSAWSQVTALDCHPPDAYVAAGHHRMQHGPVKNQPVCSAHGGFALAGASNESHVHVWDIEIELARLRVDKMTLGEHEEHV